jgi:hypothetical protein
MDEGESREKQDEGVVSEAQEEKSSAQLFKERWFGALSGDARTDFGLAIEESRRRGAEQACARASAEALAQLPVPLTEREKLLNRTEQRLVRGLNDLLDGRRRMSKQKCGAYRYDSDSIDAFEEYEIATALKGMESIAKMRRLLAEEPRPV